MDKTKVQHYINSLFDILVANKVTNMTVGFSGQGDDGCMDIEHFHFENILDNDDNIKYNALMDEPVLHISSPYTAIKEDLTVHKLILNICDLILDEEGVDWVNGSGNRGGVDFDVKNREVRLTYRVMEDKTVIFGK